MEGFIMLFTANKPLYTHSNLCSNSVKTIRSFYVQNSCLELLVNVANLLRESKYLLILEDKGIAFSCEYLADCLAYLNTGLDEISNGRISISKKKFFKELVPINGNPKIELTPREVVRFAIKAMERSPTGELNAIIPFMKDFQTIFESKKIQSALKMIVS